MVLINKKEYNCPFENKFVEIYCNLNIYPLVGILEKEAGLLSDIAEAFKNENTPLNYKIFPFEYSSFLIDNLLNFENDSGFVINYIPDTIKKIFLIKNSFITLSLENEVYNKLYKKINIHGLTKVLYFENENCYSTFEKYFWYYFQNGIFYYDNLICYTMIVKNAGPILEKVLIDNLPIIDRWCILDTGSTDGTQDVIKRILKDKKGVLYEEPFVDFKVSRNRCLELAKQTCKFILMLDDTYSIKGDLRTFLNEVRGDQFSDSFSLLIQSDDTEYYSNRIIKSTTNLRYIHRIHEVISDQSNINVTVPSDKAVIFDNRIDYMEKRTMDRKQFDLELLFKEVEEFPDDPRALYYIAQTYGCIGDEINKAKYFELRINHPQQGYIQEKIDACFELARTYNFKIDPIDQIYYQPLNLNFIIKPESWIICEKLYLQAYLLDQKRPDSLYFIGIHYYLEGKYDKSYTYFKKAFETGYPIGSQYSLKPTLSFHFLPKFLTEMCYHFKDFETGLNAAKLFLNSSKFNTPSTDSWNLMANWHRIHENLVKMPQLNETPIIMDRKIFCIVTDGGWEPWTGEDINTKGLGGSETWIVEMSRWISRIGKYHVVVFCKTEKSCFFEDVGYNPISSFHHFISNNIVEYCIISRYTEYIPVAIHGHAQNIGLILHDNLAPELIIPVHQKIKWIWGLTQWHSKNIKQTFPQFEKIINVMNYGIDKIESKQKIKNSFIYSSFPNRGLIVLLKMWPKIKKLLPDAVLNIYCNLEQEWVNQVSPDMMNEIKKLLKINKSGITVHGWVSKLILKDAWKTSEFWLYPCIFEETFCLTALEAAISKTFVITNDLAALKETGNKGLIINGNPLTNLWQNECLNEIFHLKNDFKEQKIEENYQWAKTLTWETQANKLNKIINN